MCRHGGLLIAFILLGGEDDSGAFCCLGTSVLSSSGGCLGFFPEACAECAGAAVSAVPLSAVSGCPIRYVLCGGRAFHSADSDSSLAQADDRRRGCEDPCSDSNVRGAAALVFFLLFFSYSGRSWRSVPDLAVGNISNSNSIFFRVYKNRWSEARSSL